MSLDLFENHSQGEGGTELSEEATPEPEPADDTAEAQPSIEEDATGGGRTGDATPSAGNEGGGNAAPSLPDAGEVSVGDSGGEV